MGDGLAAVAYAVFILLIIFIPLGSWKLIEIAIWLFSHISVEIK
jgi:hypothetical protein